MQRRLRSPRYGLVHPMARAAFARALERHTLYIKFFANKRIQVYAAGNDIAA